MPKRKVFSVQAAWLLGSRKFKNKTKQEAAAALMFGLKHKKDKGHEATENRQRQSAGAEGKKGNQAVQGMRDA